jgi:hypothetical protein
MTTECVAARSSNTPSHSRGAERPKFCRSFRPQEVRGRREDRVRAAPAVSCAKLCKQSAHEHTGSAETLRPSLRNGFTAYAVLSPATNSFLSPSSANMVLPDPVGLTTPPPTWHQQRMPGPHGFAVRFSAVRLRAVDRSRAFRQPALPSRATPNAVASTASRPNVRDDGQRPSTGTGWRDS